MMYKIYLVYKIPLRHFAYREEDEILSGIHKISTRYYVDQELLGMSRTRKFRKFLLKHLSHYDNHQKRRITKRV